MHRYFSESAPWGASISRRRLLQAAGLAGAGAAGAAVLGPALTASGASRADRWSLHDTMRKLWEDHVTWTRMVIVSFIAGSPDLDERLHDLYASAAANNADLTRTLLRGLVPEYQPAEPPHTMASLNAPYPDGF